MDRIRYGWRIAASLVLLAIVWVYNFTLSPQVTLASGEVAGRQFENSDKAYVATSYQSGLLSHVLIPGGLVLILLLLIWLRPLRRLLVAAGVLLLLGHPAWAYYDKQDYTEAVTIYPNETAFWIPDNGGNRDSQGRMDSAEYYQANKVALKRFLVPHSTLSGSGWGPWGNYYVPSGRLILVDRTPFNREWTKASDRGTAAHDESFPCQDNQGHDVTVEMTIGTSVFEENAAKFLYRFGVKPPLGDRTDPHVIFTSVYYGRNLTEVMDSVGRGAVQAMVCSEISTRDLDHVNAEAAQMLATIQKRATDFFAGYGITLDYLGWAGTFTFSPGVQDAIDRRYVADKDREIAAELQPLAATIEQLAAADALRAFGQHTDGRLPNTIVGLPSNVGGLLSGLLSTADPLVSARPGPATH